MTPVKKKQLCYDDDKKKRFLPAHTIIINGTPNRNRKYFPNTPAATTLKRRARYLTEHKIDTEIVYNTTQLR